MSKSWGYKCLDCNKSSESYLHNGKDALRQLYPLGPSLQEASDKCSWLDIRVMGTDHYDQDPIEFLAEHQGHNIVLESEYGDIEEINDGKT